MCEDSLKACISFRTRSQSELAARIAYPCGRASWRSCAGDGESMKGRWDENDDDGPWRDSQKKDGSGKSRGQIYLTWIPPVLASWTFYNVCDIVSMKPMRDMPGNARRSSIWVITCATHQPQPNKIRWGTWISKVTAKTKSYSPSLSWVREFGRSIKYFCRAEVKCMSKPSVVRIKSSPNWIVWEDSRSAMCRATGRCGQFTKGANNNSSPTHLRVQFLCSQNE